MLDGKHSKELANATKEKKTTYFSGGPGYFMNRIAFKKLIENGIRNKTFDCHEKMDDHEDVPIGKL